MKKIIAIFIMIFICCVMFIGCNKQNQTLTIYETTTVNELDGRFKVIADDNLGTGYCNVIVDNETGVMYLFRGSMNRGGLTVMVDADGNPLIYSGDVDNG
jgi:hypothetical protein